MTLNILATINLTNIYLAEKYSWKQVQRFHI